MKNKQSKPTNKGVSSAKPSSKKLSNLDNKSTKNNEINYKLLQDQSEKSETHHNQYGKNAPSISQINRLKKFYNTTRWLPNSAFTTFFGKPAFENYGYGNTNPTYGGLFYGNYMLSHNINPVDGENLPETKQVYGSCMYKASKNTKDRRPSPPRKVPDDIRNTRDELKEINCRKPIFQKNNNFPNREIKKPNLIKAKYFKSPKNSPNRSMEQDENEINGEFDLEGFLDGKGEFKKKKKINNKKDGEFFNKEIKKKHIKENIDNTNKDYLRALKDKENVKNNYESHKDNMENSDNIEEEENNKDGVDENEYNLSHKNEVVNYNKQQNKESGIKNQMKNFYEKMLEEKIDENNQQVKGKNFNNSTMINAQQTTNISEDVKGENLRTRIIKKENPCLLPNSENK
jgi:hypothetical protein